MKKLIPALLILFLLSGCAGQTEAPIPAPGAEPETLTAPQVLDAYAVAAEVYDWFDLRSPDVTGKVVEADGMSYQEVNHPFIKVYGDLKVWVERHFAPELAEDILSSSQNYRDIDGRLYTAGGARGGNVYLSSKTAEAVQVADDHWQVVLTFWADSWKRETFTATVGCSQTTLDYRRVGDGWRFTNFCPSDGLNMEAETVYTFTYHSDCLIAYEKEMPDWPDVKLACWLLHSDGAYTEGPANDLFDRLMDHPAEVIAMLAELPEEWQSRLLPLLGSTAAWRDATVPEVLRALDLTEAAQQQVVEDLIIAYENTLSSSLLVTDAAEFSLLIEDRYLSLGPQTGTFPWGYALEGEVVYSGPADTYGTAYDVDCGTMELTYCKTGDGAEYLTRMVTDSAEAGYMTWEGVSHGTPEDKVLWFYPTAVQVDWITGDDFDTCWVYEPPGTKHIAFYLQNGAVVRIEVADWLDGRMLD